jgi:uroporphyrinogen-III synthase
MRVLLLRPESQAQASAVRLNALGHEALIAPALSIEATDTPPPPGPFAAVIATSSNALPALRNAGGAIAALPAFTVGRRTGVALTEAGFGNVASATDAWSLARLIIDRIMPGRLLLVAGRDRKSEPEGSLRESRSGRHTAPARLAAYRGRPGQRLPATSSAPCSTIRAAAPKPLLFWRVRPGLKPNFERSAISAFRLTSQRDCRAWPA